MVYEGVVGFVVQGFGLSGFFGFGFRGQQGER